MENNINNNPNKYLSFIEPLDYEEYYLINNFKIYKITIVKANNELIIKCKKYMITLNSNDLSILTKNDFKTIDEAFKFIVNIFEENMVIIKNIKINKMIKLMMNSKDEISTEITLSYKENNKDLFFDEIKKLKKDIFDLKEENKKLKNEINNLKEIINSEENIKYLPNNYKESYTDFVLDNTFTVFKSVNNEINIIYSNKKNYIINYNLDKKKIVNIINSNHKEYITSFKHYLDKSIKKDFIISVSCFDSNLKLWSVNNWNCLFDIYNNGLLYSACFLNENNKNYILTSSINKYLIRVYNFTGRLVKYISNSQEYTCFIDTFYDVNNLKNYVITGNFGYIKSYDFNQNKIYHKYCDNDNNYHLSIVIKKNIKLIELIESSLDQNIRIWNFHTGKLLQKIRIEDYYPYGICLSNLGNYLFVGLSNGTIKIIELKTELIIKNLYGHNKNVLTIKTINHTKYGHLLITQGWYDDKIIIWENKKK